ncbi:ferrous iron transport protein B [Methanothermobacter sp. DP]|uniref:ferrous iron transport protein B n=1 Tax=Methanothermobacter sp. DP TaxID=2998972 RepID=UPI002AA55C9A|nr:ferrous iron transport protein B [Methanothermobacter sp. DP]
MEKSEITVALAGNANVGKSVIFNQLTGSNQIVGNWPGKTVERAEGYLKFQGRDIHIIDLPGIYSFSTYSMEEIVSREFIVNEKPDVVINVLDASVLERNLFFTLQLMEMEVPMVICINQVDMARQKGIVIDEKKLEGALGVPVVSTVAVKGQGLQKLLRKTLEVADKKIKPEVIEYGEEVESRIRTLMEALPEIPEGYSKRWVAIKLLENDPEITAMMPSDVKKLAAELAAQVERIHNEPSFSVMASERYALSNMIAAGAQKQSEIKTSLSERLDSFLTHPIYGYISSVLVVGGLLLWTFVVGEFLSDTLTNIFGFFQPVDPQFSGSIESIIWNGAFGGIVAGLTLVIPFVIPFYLMLSYIENSGLLTRVAFMMDAFMRKIGLHGKALIPLILGYGCSVPAIDSTRILETPRERLLAAFAISFAPCAARTILILGLVALFVSVWWAIGLYALDLLIIFIMGKLALKALPGETTGLIMEMHSLKMPSFRVIARQTWTRTKSLIYLVFPIYIIGSALIQLLYALGLLNPVSNIMAPLTAGWLHLPVFAGILLILGAVRKEFILLGLVSLVGTDIGAALTAPQILVLTLVGMLYFPCLSTIAVLAREFGWKSTSIITLANLGTALFLGGLFARILPFIM